MLIAACSIGTTIVAWKRSFDVLSAWGRSASIRNCRIFILGMIFSPQMISYGLQTNFFLVVIMTKN